ncbi:MAG: hypothetical protein PHC61_07560 [Chitinivibrionales bacterium]|nr:hypothetical protein [Chitinivibrionales bacterium]
MTNEILEELWKTKDQIAAQHDFNIVKLINKLKEKQKKHKANIVDFSKEIKKAA